MKKKILLTLLLAIVAMMWAKTSSAQSLKATGATYSTVYVDLGLPSGTLWARCNLGANTPEEYGDYYAWGETNRNKANYTWDTYKWGTEDALQKYNTTDGKIILDSEDDAATALLGADWRMPTQKEMQEIIDKCTWTWTTQNNVKGYVVKGPNNNSIFLPAAGLKVEAKIMYTTERGYYWSRSLESMDAAYVTRFISSGYVCNSMLRYHGFPIRPVCAKAADGKISVIGVSLNTTTQYMSAGDATTLVGTVLPSNATNKRVAWTSSDFSVASVDALGNVKALSPGTATITVTTLDGYYTACCTVTVVAAESNTYSYEYVDLGLDDGTLWATCNIGATKPEEYGNYYAWGELGTKAVYSWDTYKWGTRYALTKYNATDNKTILDTEDDAATQKLGEPWQTPTDSHFETLKNGCTWNVVSMSGVIGYQGTSKKNGKTIFLPFAGYHSGVELINNFVGYYWNSCTGSNDNSYKAGTFVVDYENGVFTADIERFLGFPIRPIISKKYLGLMIAGEKVTTTNCNDLSIFSEVNGTASYDPATKTLTLRNATIETAQNAVYGIENESVDNLTVKLLGTNKISCNDIAVIFGKNTSIIGPGSLDIVSNYMDGIKLNNNASLEIKDGAKVTVSGNDHGIYGSDSGSESVVVNNASLSAKGKNGSICGLKTFRIKDCTVTQPKDCNFNSSRRAVTIKNTMIIVTDWVKITPAASAITLTEADALPAQKQGVYNLQGVRMKDDINNLPAGIYVIDGRKVVKR